MAKYYKVFLSKKLLSNPENYVICTKLPFSIGTFRELITKKIIVSWEKEITRKITYEHYFVIYDNKEEENYINNMDKTALEKHVNEMNLLEEEKNQYYIGLQKEMTAEQTIAKKNIKKSLRKIKQR